MIFKTSETNSVLTGVDGPTDPDRIPLVTRLGNSIENSRRKEIELKTLRAGHEQLFSGKHPTAKLRALSNSHNCMGMVFASRRTCIDEDDVPVLLGETS